MISYTSTIYTLVFHIAMLHTSTANDRCCTNPDIQLTVDCTSISGEVQWQWQSDTETLWGFIINYSCIDEDYCNENVYRQAEYRDYGTTQSHSKTKKELGIPDHGSCWFWVVNVGASVMYDDGRGCSNVVHCNVSLPTISSSTEAKSTIGFIESSSVILDPTLLVSPSATSVIVSHKVSTAPILLSSSILSSSSTALPSSASLVSVPIPVESTSVYLTINTISESAIVTTEQTSAITEMLNMAMETTSVMATPLESQPSLLSQLPPTSTTQTKILFFVVFSCIIIFIVLSLTITLIFYWNKRKQRKFKVSLNTQIEKECCKDIVSITKESDSEIEIVIDCGSEDEAVSITEDDLYMYNKILHNQQRDILQQTTPLALSQLSILTDSDSDDSSSVRLSSDYYCANSGSAGRCLQSNTSNSQHETSLSSTPTVSIENVKLSSSDYQATL